MAVAYQTSTTGTGTGASVSVNVPSGLAAGDAWLIIICQDDDNGVVAAPTADWDVVVNFNDTWPRCGAIIKRNCTGSETAVTVSITGGSGGILYHSIRISGQDTSTPIDGTPATDVTSGSGTTMDAPNVTAARADSLAIGIIIHNDHGTATPPAEFTAEIADTNDGSSLLLATAYAAIGAGSFAPGNWTTSRNGSPGRATCTFVIQPPAGGGPVLRRRGSLALVGVGR